MSSSAAPDQPGPYAQPLDPKAQARADKAYRKAMRPWWKKKRFILPLLLLVLIVAANLGGGDEESTAAGGSEPAVVASSAPADPAASADPAPPAESAPAEPAAPAEPSAEPAIVVSAQDMIDTLEGNALAAKNTYNGKLVTVSGVVGSIDASGAYFALDPAPDSFIITGIQVQTSEEFLDQVAGFTAGQPVTVTGTISDVGELLGYVLEAETIA